MMVNHNGIHITKDELRVRNEFLAYLEKRKGRKIVFYDMDGVIVDFESMAEEWGKKIGISKEEFIAKKMYRQPIFYLEMKPMEGALESLKRVAEKYEVRILSAPSWDAPSSFTEKRLWMEKHFGDWGIKRMDLSFAKDLALGHFLVDDRFKYGVRDFIGEHIHFGSKKFPSLKEVESYLMSK